MSLWDKENSARKKFVGKKIRRQFSKGRYSECVRIEAHGPPSGWTCAYEIFTANGGRMLVERLSEVEVKPSTRR